jgi:hypothetical protein
MDDKRITKKEFIVGCIIALGFILICGLAENNVLQGM